MKEKYKKFNALENWAFRFDGTIFHKNGNYKMYPFTNSKFIYYIKNSNLEGEKIDFKKI